MAPGIDNSQSQRLRLVDGKFMRGNVEVPVEIGNPEQIALLQKVERAALQREKVAKAEELPIELSVTDIRYTTLCSLTCICGHEIEERVDGNRTDFWENLENPDYLGGNVICPRCKREYEILDSDYAKLVTR